MGQAPLENEYGTCPTCDWDPWSPQHLTCVIANVQPPIGGGPWPSLNGFHTLHATGLCKWRKDAPCYTIWFELGMITKFGALVYIGCDPGTPFQYFIDETQVHCSYQFTNQIPGPPELQYQGGTGFVNLNLVKPAGAAVPDWGLLGADGWKYEHAQADDDLEQYYIGSHKYKTNCRILFDPDAV